jgi:DNA-binding beta-propeller fold protein YncE
MPTAPSCAPVTTQLTRHTRFLGSQPVPPGYNAEVFGLAADDHYVYATYSLNRIDDGHDSPAPGELLILDPARLAQPDLGDPVVARVSVGYQPRSVVVNRNTGRIYVMNYGQQGEFPYSVFVVERTVFGQYAVTARIPLGQGLLDLAVNEQTNRIYVSNGYAGGGKIHVIDGVTNTELVDRAIAVPYPSALAFDATTGTLYATLTHQTGEQLNAIAVIACGADGNTHTVKKIVAAGPERSQPWNAAVVAPPAGQTGPHRLLVANIGAAGVVSPNVTAFELDNGSLAARPPVVTAFGGPVGLAVNAAIGQAYVATNAGFQVLDIARETIESPVTFGPFPLSATVDGAGRVHVGDGRDGSLSTVVPVAGAGPIAEHLDESGGLGAALTAPVPVPGDDPAARYQIFEQGTVVASTDYGAITLSPEISVGWLARAEALGVPVEGSVALAGPDGYETAPFQRGLLVHRSATASVAPGSGSTFAVLGDIPSVAPGSGSTFAVLGDIASCYQRPENTAALGLPVANEEPLPDGGIRQVFEKGEIYWRSDLGAHALYGIILFWWNQSGATNGPRRYPITDVVDATINGAPWQTCHFEDGVMYGIPGTETAWVIRGEIGKAYQDKFGGPTGELGPPASDESPTPTSGGWYQDFANGVLVWHPDGSPYAGARRFFGAELRITYASIGGSQGPIEGDRDLYILGVVERVDHPGAEPVNLLNRGFPYEDGDYGEPEHTFDPPHSVQLADVLRGGMEFQVMFASYDKDGGGLGSSEQTGTVNHGLVHPPWNDHPYDWDVQPPYTVDNLWGFEDGGDHDQYKFRITYTITEPAQPWDPGKQFRQQWWWKVHNFETDRLDWQQYSRAFVDVDPDPSWFHVDVNEYVNEGLEAFFYHAFIKGCAKPGNCFGMSTEAIYAMKGRSLYNEPIHEVGNPIPRNVDHDHWGEPDPSLDKGLINEFNVRHAYQFGAPTVEFFLRMFGLGMTHNPKEVFRKTKTAHDNGENPVLNLSRFWGGTGHTVLPIGWVGGDNDDVGPDEVWGMIWVADPYKEWEREGTGDSDSKYAVVIYGKNHFSYDKWGGGQWLDDRLYWIPWSRLDRVPHTPGFWLAMEILRSSFTVFGGDADIVQVTDQAGRRLFGANLAGAPRGWGDLEADLAKRIPDLVPVPFSGAGEPREGPVMLYGHHADATLTHAVTGTGTYRWGLRTPGMGVVLTSRAGAVADQITAERLGTAHRAVAFSVPPGGAAKPISLVFDGVPRSYRAKQFLVDQLPVVPKQRLTARIADGGRELLISNAGPKTTFGLRMRPAPGYEPTPAKQVPLAAGKVTRVRPADWRPDHIAGAPLRVEVRDTVDGPPIQCFDL